MQKNKAIFVFIAVILLLFVFNSAEAQCAMCKQSAESTLKNDPKSMARSLNSGILYLMAVPYIMLVFIFRKQIKTLLLRFKAKFSHTS